MSEMLVGCSMNHQYLHMALLPQDLQSLHNTSSSNVPPGIQCVVLSRNLKLLGGLTCIRRALVCCVRFIAPG
jgi:hypothetical protein